MTANEKWNKIVSLYEKYSHSPEVQQQNVWESIFVEILGYSRLDGDIERYGNPSLKRTESVVPDMIIKSAQGEVCVVEFMQPNVFFQPALERKFLSAWKESNRDICIFVRDKLHVYYVGDSQLRIPLQWEISFTKNNPEGIEFIEIMSKARFDREKFKTVLLEKNRFKLTVERIIEEVTLPATVNVFKEYFEKKYTTEAVDEAFRQVSISITRNLGTGISSFEGNERRTRGETFSFEKCGIPKGATLQYIKEPWITCTVYDDRKVLYNQQIMYMSALVKMLTGKEVTVAAQALFSYNGKSLQEYYRDYQQAGESAQSLRSKENSSLGQGQKEMTKAGAVALFNQAGLSVPKHCTFASLNRNGQYYWGTAIAKVLHFDWWIILNDTSKRKLYCFKIPANTYSEEQVFIRKDKNLVDFNVLYEEDAFRDRRSKIDFKGWLMQAISY